MTDPQSKPADATQSDDVGTQAEASAKATSGATEAAHGEAASAVDPASAGIESGDVPGGEAPIDMEEGDTAGESGEDEMVAALEAQVADLKDKLLRAVAEQENVRRRAQKDVENATRRSIKSFAGDMLAVADNMRRALGSVDEATRKENPALENLLIGVEMTERELMNAFGRHGITQMQPVGERFDPNFHEAMFEYEDPSQPAGTVGQVVETGYAIQGQALRAAKVGVTKGGPKAESKPAANAAAAQADDEVAKPGPKPEMGAEPGSHVDESL